MSPTNIPVRTTWCAVRARWPSATAVTEPTLPTIATSSEKLHMSPAKSETRNDKTIARRGERRSVVRSAAKLTGAKYGVKNLDRGEKTANTLIRMTVRKKITAKSAAASSIQVFDTVFG